MPPRQSRKQLRGSRLGPRSVPGASLREGKIKPAEAGAGARWADLASCNLAAWLGLCSGINSAFALCSPAFYKALWACLSTPWVQGRDKRVQGLCIPREKQLLPSLPSGKQPAPGPCHAPRQRLSGLCRRWTPWKWRWRMRLATLPGLWV